MSERWWWRSEECVPVCVVLQPFLHPNAVSEKAICDAMVSEVGVLRILEQRFHDPSGVACGQP